MIIEHYISTIRVVASAYQGFADYIEWTKENKDLAYQLWIWMIDNEWNLSQDRIEGPLRADDIFRRLVAAFCWKADYWAPNCWDAAQVDVIQQGFEDGLRLHVWS
jgi:hypothetical protein